MSLTPIQYFRTPDWEASVATAINQLLKGANVLSIDADHDAKAGEDILLADATAAVVTVTLPAASRSKGTQFIVKKVDASANAVTIDGDGDNIDGAATVDLTTQYESRTLISSGTDWAII